MVVYYVICSAKTVKEITKFTCGKCLILFIYVFRFFKQFFDISELDESLTYEMMAKSTPGYQIGEIKHLRRILSMEISSDQQLITEKEFNNVINSGQIKQLFVAREDISLEDIGGHEKVKDTVVNIMVSSTPTIELSL